MGETTSISVSEATLERFNETKATPEGEVEPSADLFLTHLLNEWDQDRTEVPAAGTEVIGDDEVAVFARDPETAEKLADAIYGLKDAAGGGDLEERIRKLEEIIERVPQDTAEKLRGEFR